MDASYPDRHDRRHKKPEDAILLLFAASFPSRLQSEVEKNVAASWQTISRKNRVCKSRVDA